MWCAKGCRRHLDGSGGSELWTEERRSGFPKGGEAAMFAETKDAFIGGAEDGFGAGVVELLDGLAGAAHQGQQAGFDFRGGERRKFHAPEIQVGINEGQAVGVDAIRGAHFADDADGSFAVAIGATKDELLLGRKLVMRNDAGAVEAEKDGVGGLGENFAVEIAADQEDGNFFRDAASDTHNLQWQLTSQRRGRGGTFWYLIV